MRSEWRMWSSQVRRSWNIPHGIANVIYPLLGDRVLQDDGSLAPREFTYVEMPADRTLPYFVVECEHQGKSMVPVVMGVHVVQRKNGREVRASDWRRLRLEDAIREAWTTASNQAEKPADGSPDHLDRASRSDLTLRRSVASLRTRARQRITDAHLAEVAMVYRDNVASGRPTKAVGERFNYPPSTASYYVSRARKAGHPMSAPNLEATSPPSPQ